MDKNKMAVDVFDRCASAYQDKYMDVQQYHESIDLFCKSIAKENAAILELACGPGNITRYILEQRPDFKILATDLAPNMLDLAQRNSPEAAFQLMDCRDIGKLQARYDGIVCGFALPYLSKDEAEQLIADTAKLLNEGGMLYLSTMEDHYAKSGLQTSSAGNQLYMYYHEAGYLADALERNGFNIIDLKRQDFSDGDVKMTDLIIVAGLP